MARTLAWFYLAGGVVGLLSLLAPMHPSAVVPGLIGNCAIAFGAAAFLFATGDRLPRWAVGRVPRRSARWRSPWPCSGTATAPAPTRSSTSGSGSRRSTSSPARQAARAHRVHGRALRRRADGHRPRSRRDAALGAHRRRGAGGRPAGGVDEGAHRAAGRPPLGRGPHGRPHRDPQPARLRGALRGGAGVAASEREAARGARWATSTASSW